MVTKSFPSVLALAVVTALALISFAYSATPTPPPRSGSPSILSAQINKAPEVSSNQFVDIPGLTLELPRASATQKYALIILNVPQPYAAAEPPEGANFPGVDFGINVNGSVVASGGFTYPMKRPESFARVPFTLVVRVELKRDRESHVRAQWKSVRNGIGRIDTFASISATIGS